MRPDDFEFCTRRAQEEQGRAERSQDPAVARAHTAMANEYARRAKGMAAMTMALAVDNPESRAPVESTTPQLRAYALRSPQDFRAPWRCSGEPRDPPPRHDLRTGNAWSGASERAGSEGDPHHPQPLAPPLGWLLDASGIVGLFKVSTQHARCSGTLPLVGSRGALRQLVQWRWTSFGRAYSEVSAERFATNAAALQH